MGETRIGGRIRLRREELGLSIPEFADRMGVDPSHVRKWERGDIKDIRASALRRMAYHLRCSMDWLVGQYQPGEDRESEMLPTAV